MVQRREHVLHLLLDVNEESIPGVEVLAVLLHHARHIDGLVSDVNVLRPAAKEEVLRVVRIPASFLFSLDFFYHVVEVTVHAFQRIHQEWSAKADNILDLMTSLSHCLFNLKGLQAADRVAYDVYIHPSIEGLVHDIPHLMLDELDLVVEHLS